MLSRRIATPLAGLVLASVLAASLGCASPVYRRDYGPIVGMGGGTYDVALPGPKSRLAAVGWEQTRNNDNLSEVTGADLLRAQAFPSLGGSTLARPRYLYISQSEQQMIFFGKTRRSRSVYP